MRGCFDLDVAARAEVHVFAFGQFQNKVLDEGGNVLVGTHGAFPLLYAEHLLGHLDVHVLLDRHLTRQPVPAGGFPLGDVAFFRGQDRAAASMDLYPALGTGSAPATCGGHEQLLLGEGLQQLAPSRNRNRLFPIDRDIDVPRGHEPRARAHDDRHKREDDQGEQQNTKCKSCHSLPPLQAHAAERHEGKRHQTSGDECDA